MSIDMETSVRYARAETNLFRKASAVLTKDCALVREHHGCASDRTIPPDLEHSASSCARAEHCFILDEA
jgi:hypothetical protein